MTRLPRPVVRCILQLLASPVTDVSMPWILPRARVRVHAVERGRKRQEQRTRDESARGLGGRRVQAGSLGAAPPARAASPVPARARDRQRAARRRYRATACGARRSAWCQGCKNCPWSAARSMCPAASPRSCAHSQCSARRFKDFLRQACIPHCGRRLLLKEYSDAVYGALGRWNRAGASHGTRSFRMGLHNYMTGVASSVECVEKLIRLCPRAEVFSSHRMTLIPIEQRTTDEHWMLDLPTWTRFCSTMTNLTRVDWTHLLFATIFFEIFGQHPKPKLKELEITAAMNWRWKYYLSELDMTTREAIENGGYAGTAVKVHAALRACPNLEELELHWYNSSTGTRTGDPEMSSRGFLYPLTRMMDPNVFGDEFCEAVVAHCKILRKFHLEPVADDLLSNRPITSFTDRACQALATLLWLEDVGIEP